MNKKLIVTGAILLLLFGFSSKGVAGVSISIGFPLPPPFVFPAPPSVVVIPGTYVYFCPDVQADIFFYGGNWYRPYEGRWYWATAYNGPWVYVASPPAVFLSLPRDYRIITRGYAHIPYGELNRNWRAWERGRYWEHHNWGRREFEHDRHMGVAPSFREKGGGFEKGHGGSSSGHGGYNGGHTDGGHVGGHGVGEHERH